MKKFLINSIVCRVVDEVPSRTAQTDKRNAAE